jgi:hypothetical protein
MNPVAGDDQIAAVNSEVAVPPSVRVTDADGKPVAGVTVNFVVTDGGGTLLNPQQTTASDGTARLGGWTLGSPGSNAVEARAASVEGSPVVFHATAVSTADVNRFVFVQQPEGTRVKEKQEMKVAMVDAAGNIIPLSGIEIYLGLFRRGRDDEFAANNSLLIGDRFAETKNGVATFHLGVSEVGTYKFRALSDDLPGAGPHGPEPFLFSDPFNVY